MSLSSPFIRRPVATTLLTFGLVAAGIIAFTVFEVGATAATPVWVTLAIFTVNHFIEMHERQLHKESLSGAPSLAPIRVAN